MEIYEIRYFLTTAETENVGKAAQRLAVSAPAVSRAIGRLEEELGVQLFERVGRNIVLSGYGKQFQQEASRIVDDLDDVKARFKPIEFGTSVSICGTEFGLSAYLVECIEKLHQTGRQFSLEVKIGDSSKDVERKIADGESHLGIVANQPSSQFRSKRLGSLRSRTYVGEGHPLYTAAKREIETPIEKVLEHPFAGFIEPFIFGAASPGEVGDGWRDDKFPRTIALRAASIEAALRTVEAGIYLSYVPEAIARDRRMLPLKITGCPYKCETEIFLLSRKTADYAWMMRLF